SQLNGCAFCVDMHIKMAKIHGERELRLHHVAIWRESTLFSPRERAALAWTEAITNIATSRAPDADYDSLRAEFSESEMVNL
ncbi:carboxymuconolactone decarboxylase family protein, partial [Variovorax sp. 2RAF20]